MEVEAKHDVLLRSLEKFYDDAPHAFDEFRRVVRGEERLSLRVLDWLVTNYAKKRNIVYTVRVDDRDVAMNLFLEYKSQLKAYSKRFFDPFCRRGRVTYGGVQTTCGQLNFFRWAVQYGVLGYAREHHDEIEQDMLASIQHRATATATAAAAAAAARRKELSKAAIKTCTTTRLKVKVMFS